MELTHSGQPTTAGKVLQSGKATPKQLAASVLSQDEQKGNKSKK